MMPSISIHTDGSVTSADTSIMTKELYAMVSEPLPALAVPTPDQDAELHRTKRIKTVQVDDPVVQLASRTVSGVSGHPCGVWLRDTTKQFKQWLQTLAEMNQMCYNIPNDSVIKLSLALIQ